VSLRKKGSFNINKSIARFQRLKPRLPRQIANQALNFFGKSFRQGGFADKVFKRWPKRFKRLSRLRSSRTIKEAATLVKSGHLRGAWAVLSASFSKISVGTRGVRYARRHNEGLTDRLGRKMPKRKFIGKSTILERKLERRIVKEIDKTFKF